MRGYWHDPELTAEAIDARRVAAQRRPRVPRPRRQPGARRPRRRHVHPRRLQRVPARGRARARRAPGGRQASRARRARAGHRRDRRRVRRARRPGAPRHRLDELRAWCRARLADYKAPDRWSWSTSLPRHADGEGRQGTPCRCPLSDRGTPGSCRSPNGGHAFGRVVAVRLQLLRHRLREERRARSPSSERLNSRLVSASAVVGALAKRPSSSAAATSSSSAGHHAVHQPELLRVGGGELVAEERELLRPLQTDEAGQQVARHRRRPRCPAAGTARGSRPCRPPRPGRTRRRGARPARRPAPARPRRRASCSRAPRRSAAARLHGCGACRRRRSAQPICAPVIEPRSAPVQK